MLAKDDGIAQAFADELAGEGRDEGDAAGVGSGFVDADDSVTAFVPGVVAQRDGGREAHFVLGESGWVDADGTGKAQVEGAEAGVVRSQGGRAVGAVGRGA